MANSPKMPPEAKCSNCALIGLGSPIDRNAVTRCNLQANPSANARSRSSKARLQMALARSVSQPVTMCATAPMNKCGGVLEVGQLLRDDVAHLVDDGGAEADQLSARRCVARSQVLRQGLTEAIAELGQEWLQTECDQLRDPPTSHRAILGELLVLQDPCPRSRRSSKPKVKQEVVARVPHSGPVSDCCLRSGVVPCGSGTR